MGKSLFPDRLETERLLLEPLDTDTVDPFEYYRICSGQDSEDMGEVTEYLTWDPHDHPRETFEFFDHIESKRADGQGAEYVIRPKEREPRSDEIAGATGITVDWDRRTAVLGMWLRKPFWGRGYSGERAAALMEVAFERLDLELVAVSHEVGNEKSRRAIEKYVAAHGGREEGLLRNWAAYDGPVDVRRYSVSREEYFAATGSEDRSDRP